MTEHKKGGAVQAYLQIRLLAARDSFAQNGATAQNREGGGGLPNSGNAPI